MMRFGSKGDQDSEKKGGGSRVYEIIYASIYDIWALLFRIQLSLEATARSYRRQDGADAAARFEKFLPARASLRPPISLKFPTE